MAPLEYKRWKDFALRMARTCFYGHRRPTSKWITEVVADYFDSFDLRFIPCIVDWDNSDNSGVLVCDDVSAFLADYYRGEAPQCNACKTHETYERDGECTCDEIDGLFYDQWDEQWGGPVHCCIRAGLDFAASPSAGVLGFTAGDIRKMFPEGVPDWVFPPGERLQYAFTDELNGTFASLPDSAGVVM